MFQMYKKWVFKMSSEDNIVGGRETDSKGDKSMRLDFFLHNLI